MRKGDRKPNLSLRRARGRLSQAKLAELVNHQILRATGSMGAVTAKSISDWERGWYLWPSAHVRAALCAVLEVPDAADLGFRQRRSTHADPARIGTRLSAEVRRFSLTELHVDRPTADNETTSRLAVTGGRNFAGTEITAQFRLGRPNDHHQLTVHTSRDQASLLSRPGDRGLLIAVDFDAETPVYYAADARRIARPQSPGDVSPVPTAYLLDDLTIGIIWAVTNTDAALLADDAAMHRYQQDLSCYEGLIASAATLSEAAELTDLSQKWLGSEFCARHILQNLDRIRETPLFWTREQRGEEAAAWLLWAHKLEYLRETSRVLPGLRRGFCLPAHQVCTSPGYERVLLLLAAALMESFGVRIEVSPEPQYGDIEGFVLGGNAIVANWLHAPGLWYVEASTPPSRTALYRDLAGDVADHSIVAHVEPARRLEALADFLGLPWDWFIRRCTDLAHAGIDGLVQPSSRLLSTEGLDAAIRYVAYLDSQ